MGFQPWVPQDDTNTEIRVAMLLSLILQIALIFLGPTRKRSYHPFVIWSCYLLADWVADLALGLLLNTLGNIGGGGNSSSNHIGVNLAAGAGEKNSSNSSINSGSPMMFAFWTPFLLLHLGGPDTITAYSVEDNELWLRHLIGLLFELFSAAVIFFCSLHSNPMIGATVLMFIAGIIKYSERTYSLYSGSIGRFRANILGPGNPGSNHSRLMRAFKSKKNAGVIVEIPDTNSEAPKAPQEDAELIDISRLWSTDIKNVEVHAYAFFATFRRLFVDLILNSRQRRLSQASFLDMNRPRMAFKIIESELDFIYDMVYTKAPVAYTKAGWVLRFICSGCLVSSAVIFFLHDKRGIKFVDVGITYALLLGGLALDMAALIMLLFSKRALVFYSQNSPRFKWLEWLTSRVATKGRRWAPSVYQSSIIDNAMGLKYISRGRCGFFPLVAKMHPFSEAHTRDDILKLVFHSVTNAARKLGDDSHDEIDAVVFDFRGLRILGSYEQDSRPTYFSKSGKEVALALIMDSVRKIKYFDESLLLWHIATDLCLLRVEERSLSGSDIFPMCWISETLSRYMMYLLIAQPEMLSARSGIWLMRYQDTFAEARRFFSMDASIQRLDDARKALLDVTTSELPEERVDDDDGSKSVLFDACILAKRLWKLGDIDEEGMWRVVQQVWLQMLMYAARKCPGSTHVRRLNSGGDSSHTSGSL
ncbi:hypothetical protein PR202_gb12155 [Eleusine coracana subsp. coracana]|uniref:DUF4220 domain-containing protein n=1 Tax=Eleusine coracana subsp. coracana TaxID=191504 RepID=A0AAV5EPN7_ELECO|nr:hypothetical protein QOZ80_7BG0585540 [Eleusine coracana subsp. coracana]GJN24417.1 hypothetical protein PR202_gb12155 [Eleusine coracana subsp. coracana]